MKDGSDWNDTKETATWSLTIVSGIALVGNLIEQGNEIADVGWSEWFDSGISGVGFLLLIAAPIVLVAILLGVVSDILEMPRDE